MMEQQPKELEEVLRDKSAHNFSQTVIRLRNRSWLLRIQAFTAIGVLVLASCAIAWIFVDLQRLSVQAPVPVVTKNPYDYGLMDARHVAMAAKLKELTDLMSDARQELISDKYGKGGVDQSLVVKQLQERGEDIANLRTDLEGRLSKDREDMYREILKLRTERDRAIEESAEKRSYIRLVGEAVMRVGVLVLAIYLIAIVSNIAKYWLRVADHLNAVADSLDLLHAAGLSVQPAIAALTPHPIDFQAEDLGPVKSVKDLVTIITSLTKQASAKIER